MAGVSNQHKNAIQFELAKIQAEVKKSGLTEQVLQSFQRGNMVERFALELYKAMSDKDKLFLCMELKFKDNSLSAVSVDGEFHNKEKIEWALLEAIEDLVADNQRKIIEDAAEILGYEIGYWEVRS